MTHGLRTNVLAPTVRRCGEPHYNGAVGAVLLAAHEVATYAKLRYAHHTHAKPKPAQYAFLALLQ